MAKVLFLTNSSSGFYSFRKELADALLKENEVVLCMPAGDRTDYFLKTGCRHRRPISLTGASKAKPLRHQLRLAEVIPFFPISPLL